MHQALDGSGRLVHAGQVNPYRFDFKCPWCGEPVFRKKGSERRAHFSHYSSNQGAKCEYYIATLGGGVGTLINRGAIAARVHEFHRPILCIECDGRGSTALSLRLPLLRGDVDGGDGDLSVTSKFGVRSFNANELRTTQFFPVTPECPPARCTASGELAWIGHDVDDALAQFSFTGNFFRVSEGRGTLLRKEEPLEIGKQYRLLSQGQIFERRTIGLTVDTESTYRGWYRYLVTLPASMSRLSGSALEAAESYLGRRINEARPRADIIWPLPHHLEPDGTEVFGEETSKILLRLSASERAELRSYTRSAVLPERSASGEVEADLTGLTDEVLLVFVDGKECARLKVSECAPFRPRGVQLRDSTSVSEVFERSAAEALADPTVNKELIVPSPRVWKLIRLSGERISPAPDGTVLPLVGNWRSLEAESFGSCAMPETAQVARRAPEVVCRLPPELTAILRCAAGEDAVEKLGDLLAAGDIVGVHKLTIELNLTWLYPNIAESVARGSKWHFVA